jgi:hypothetical protein
MELSGIIQKPVIQHNNSTSEANAGGKMAAMQAAIEQKSDSVKEPVLVPQVEQIDLKRADEKRLNNIKKTVEREMSANVFVVRDNRFTIFKDAKSGQYITRFTSLRDGAVTYVPEPQILKLSGASDSYYEVTA